MNAAILKIIKVSKNCYGRFTENYPKFRPSTLIQRKMQWTFTPTFLKIWALCCDITFSYFKKKSEAFNQPKIANWIIIFSYFLELAYEWKSKRRIIKTKILSPESTWRGNWFRYEWRTRQLQEISTDTTQRSRGKFCLIWRLYERKRPI